MAEGKKQRVSRSKEDRIADIEARIAKHKENIKTLEESKQAIIEGRKKVSKAKGVKRILAEAKISDEEMAKALGITVDELKSKLMAAAEKKDK